MKILSTWFESMEPVNIEVESLQSLRHHSKAVGSFFTGGVNSFYTVLKNLDSYENESRISHLLFVHGFDIDINNQPLFKKVHKNLVVIADEL